MTPGSPLVRVAGEILDGTGVDWTGLDPAEGDVDAALVDQLRTLAALREARRRPPAFSGADAADWGHLRIVERIGQGAYGEVYRAWDTRLERDVALKLLSVQGAWPDSAGSSAIDEGRRLARVRHPNVVTIYGAERIDGRVGLWMELVRGRTLEQALHDGTIFTSREVARIGIELGRAVAAVHAAGLLHRDIKAQNVMVAEDGRLVLMDMGTGSELGGVAETHVSGTPLYLAPEVLAGGAATVASDVYSIGVVLYHLLTGTYPVQGRDLEDLRSQHATRTTSAVPWPKSGVPRRLRHAISRALDPKPERRQASAEALVAELSALKHPAAAVRVASAAVAAVAVIAVAVMAWAGRGRVATTAPAARPPATIAVMPFRNLGAEPESDDFVDGLTTEVIRHLAGIDGLEVRSQTSSFAFKGKPRDLGTIGEALRVGLVVEADVLRAGKRLRLNAQLVDVAGDVVLWSERFDRTLDDVFAIQDEISRAIVNKLRLTVGQGQRRYQTSLPAYDAYLRARVLVGRGGTRSAGQAARLFEQVIAMDPAFAPARAGLADAYNEMSWELSGLSNDEGLSGMRPAAARALELDPLLAEAHAAMGTTYARERDWRNAETSFERAIALNPTLTHVQANYVLATLLPTGQFQKAQQLLTAALTADPLSPTVRRELAWAQFCDGRFTEAIENFRLVLAADPGFPFAHQGLARALTFADRPDEAIAVWERRPGSDGNWERWLAPAYVRAGRRRDVERLVDAHRDEHPYRQALVYAALADKDRAFEALDRAADLAPHRVAQVLAYPEMALLRGDARLQALRRRLNLMTFDSR